MPVPKIATELDSALSALNDAKGRTRWAENRVKRSEGLCLDPELCGAYAAAKARRTAQAACSSSSQARASRLLDCEEGNR